MTGRIRLGIVGFDHPHVLRFAPMGRSRGYQVYHYGVEGSEAQADVSNA